MRALSLTSLAALAFVVASCDSTPVEPPGVESDPTSAQFAANQVWDNYSNYVDFVTYVACLGEDLRLYGEVPFRWHRVWNDAGGYSDVLWAEPATAKLPFTAEGLSSGNVWVARGATDPGVYHAGPGEVIQFNINETFISKDGTNFRAKGGQHLTINANGEVTAVTPFGFDFVCTGQH